MSKEVLGIITSHGFQDHIPNATNAINADNADNADNAEIALYASEDKSKGTIEERLTSLGFRQGVITFMGVECDSSSYGTNYGVVKRLGNYVLGEVNLERELTSTLINEYFGVSSDKALISFAEDFRIKLGTTSITTGFGSLGSGSNIKVHAFDLTINGVKGYASIIKMAETTGAGYIYKFKFHFWYEAKPITE